MSGLISRRVASTPVRTAAATWNQVVQLLVPIESNPARVELMKVRGVACASIASEATKDCPLVVHGCGPRVRVYCVFGDDALTGDGVDESALVVTPTDGDWAMSIPCLAEDLDWCRGELASVSSRVTARVVGADVGAGASADAESTIDIEEFRKS